MKGRNKDLIIARNNAIITRYWYWSEIWQRKYLSVLETLEQEEFFITRVTLGVIIRNDEHIYADLCKERPSATELQKRFPAFHFEDNPHHWKK